MDEIQGVGVVTGLMTLELCSSSRLSLILARSAS